MHTYLVQFSIFSCYVNANLSGEKNVGHMVKIFSDKANMAGISFYMIRKMNQKAYFLLVIIGVDKPYNNSASNPRGVGGEGYLVSCFSG